MRTKLTVILAAVFAVGATVLSVVTVLAVESTVMAQVDDGLTNVITKPALVSSGPGPGLRDASPPGAPADRPTPDPAGFRRYAELQFNAAGELLASTSSGFVDDPDPLPDLQVDQLQALVGELVTLPISQGSEVRATAARTPDGGFFVIAEPLTDQQATISRTRLLAALSSIAVVAVAALVTWLVIRREFRPVGEMIDTASSIAAGDLSHRIQHGQPQTELGQLADALDDMANQLDVAFGKQRESEDRVRNFAADASHELRTPLTVILGYAELYRKGGIPAGEPLDNAIARIESEGTRMQRLTEDLLLLARLDQQHQLEVAPVELDIVLRDTVDNAATIDPSTPFDVDSVGTLTVSGDERRLRQVFANLVANAVQHTPPETPVRVRLRSGRGAAIVEVADDGPGIDPELRARAFDRFSKGDKRRRANTAEDTGGTGLGLSIVAGIVDAHGGTVEIVEGDRPGATVRVVLPSGAAPVDDEALGSNPTARVGPMARPGL